MAAFLCRCAVASVLTCHMAVALQLEPVGAGSRASDLGTQSGCWDYTTPTKDDVRGGFRRSARAFELEESMAEVESNASMRVIIQTLRDRCVGKDWDGGRCHVLAQRLRHDSWYHLRNLVRDAGATAPENAPLIKAFRRGGGLRVKVPCHGNHAKLYYRHIYKCAGLAIKENLVANARLDYYAIDSDWGENQRCKQIDQEREAVAAVELNLTRAKDLTKPLLFTFVRNPVEKFIAGYKEIASRHLLDDMAPGVKVGSKKHALRFLENVLHGTCDNGHVLLQVQNLFGPSCESHFDFIGKLERMENDWKQAGLEGGCPRGLEWPVQPTHQSDEDDQGAEHAMRALLEKDDHHFLKVLCWWTLPDFIAFDYELPEPCYDDSHLSFYLKKAKQG